MSNKLITVATLENSNQATMIKGWLDAEGIENYILDHGISVQDAAQLEKQVELQVFENDVSKALEIIGNLKTREKTAEELPDAEISIIIKMLVPVDFSPYSLNAACYAAHVAAQKGAEITLVNVYFNPVSNPISYDHFYSFPANVAESISEIVENAGEMMREFKTKLHKYIVENELSVVKVKSELIGGIVEEAILDYADAGHFDLMIIGIRGKETMENWFGSFIGAIINKATIPVLAVPGNALYKKTMYKRLMYATNFDKSDGKAIRQLVKIARPLETHISIIHIDDTPDNPFINYDLAHFKEKYIGNIGQVEMDFDLIVNKDRARGIENYIRDHQIDILSVTSHKRNIITSLFKPSLTKELLFLLNIPMLIFHPKTN